MCDHDWKHFKVKKLKYLQTKTLENLENGEDISAILPTRYGLTIIFQFAPKVLYSYHERDDFEAHAFLL